MPTEDEMDILKAKAMSLNLNFCVIKDAGRTQIAAGSKTVLAIGPGPRIEILGLLVDFKCVGVWEEI